MKVTTLPFKISQIFEGFAETEGLLKATPDALVFEYQTQDSIVGMIKSKVKEVKVPMTSIEEIQFKKSILGHKLLIRINSLKLASSLPNHTGNEISLEIARKYADQALTFVGNIKLTAADRYYKEELSKAIEDA